MYRSIRTHDGVVDALVNFANGMITGIEITNIMRAQYGTLKLVWASVWSDYVNRYLTNDPRLKDHSITFQKVPFACGGVLHLAECVGAACTFGMWKNGCLVGRYCLYQDKQARILIAPYTPAMWRDMDNETTLGVFGVVLELVLTDRSSSLRLSGDPTFQTFYRKFVSKGYLDAFMLGIGGRYVPSTDYVGTGADPERSAVYECANYPEYVRIMSLGEYGPVVLHHGKRSRDWQGSTLTRYKQVLVDILDIVRSCPKGVSMTIYENMELLLEHHALSGVEYMHLPRASQFDVYGAMICEDLKRVSQHEIAIDDTKDYHSPDAAFMLVDGDVTITVFKNKVKISAFNEPERVRNVRFVLENPEKFLSPNGRYDERYIYFSKVVSKIGLMKTKEQYHRFADIHVEGSIGVVKHFHTYQPKEDGFVLCGSTSHPSSFLKGTLRHLTTVDEILDYISNYLDSIEYDPNITGAITHLIAILKLDTSDHSKLRMMKTYLIETIVLNTQPLF